MTETLTGVDGIETPILTNREAVIKAAEAGDIDGVITLLRGVDTVANEVVVSPHVPQSEYHGHFQEKRYRDYKPEKRALRDAVKRWVKAVQTGQDSCVTLIGTRCFMHLINLPNNGSSTDSVKQWTEMTAQSEFSAIQKALAEHLNSSFTPLPSIIEGTTPPK